MKVRRCVEDSKAFDKGLNNETDVAGIASVMEAAVRSPKLTGAARAKAWEILTGQTFNDEIPAGLHPQSGAVVGHKTGLTPCLPGPPRLDGRVATEGAPARLHLRAGRGGVAARQQN